MHGSAVGPELVPRSALHSDRAHVLPPVVESPQAVPVKPQLALIRCYSKGIRRFAIGSKLATQSIPTLSVVYPRQFSRRINGP